MGMGCVPPWNLSISCICWRWIYDSFPVVYEAFICAWLIMTFPTAHESSTETIHGLFSIPRLSAAYQPITGTFQLHFYDLSDERESGTLSMSFHSNVNGQCSVIILDLCTILHQKSSVCHALHLRYFLSLRLWLLQLKSCRLAVFLLPLAFCCLPITSLLKQPEQMFADILLISRANSGCY